MTLEVNGTKVKVNHKSTDIGGTSLQGYIGISNNVLRAKLGNGLNNCGDGKVRSEWQLEAQMDGKKVVATIYDWKESKPLNEVIRWHIGGCDVKAVSLIKQIFVGHPITVF
jgi:hypothetical protein